MTLLSILLLFLSSRPLAAETSSCDLEGLKEKLSQLEKQENEIRKKFIPLEKSLLGIIGKYPVEGKRWEEFELESLRKKILDHLYDGKVEEKFRELDQPFTNLQYETVVFSTLLSDCLDKIINADAFCAQWPSQKLKVSELGERFIPFRKTMYRVRILLNDPQYTIQHDLTGTGPYGRSQKANLAQKISTVIDNSTFGLIQTVLGAGHVIVLGVMRPVQGKSFQFDTFSDEVSDVGQLILDTESFGKGSYSLGAIQVGKAKDMTNHEAGHAVASALLGPLYLPTVGISYLTEGHEDSFLERWADMEARAPGFFNTNSTQIGLGKATINGESVPVLVLKVSLEERQLDKRKGLEIDRAYEWLETELLLPMVQHQKEIPPMIEVNLLKKKLNLDLKYSTLQTTERYGHVENNPGLNEIHVRALDYSANYGLKLNLVDKVKIVPRIGVGVSAGTQSKSFAASLSVNAGLDMKLWNYATMTLQYEKEWFSNGREREAYLGHLHNDLRNPFGKIGFIQYIDFGIQAKSETWKENNQKSKIDQLTGTLGLRF